MTFQRAIMILDELRSLLPQSATEESVRQYEEANELLESDAGSVAWIEAKNRLGAFLIETPHGDRATNIARARQLYGDVLERVSPAHDWSSWLMAESGQAHADLLDPLHSVDAVGRIERLIATCRERGDAPSAASFAINLSNALRRDEKGDMAANLERALALLLEALESISQESNADLWGRIQHNLGGIYLERRLRSRSQNVDSAVRALEAALTVRSVERDPVGRVRTLRALSVAYPKWSGPDSLAHAQELGREAAFEADEIEQMNAVAGARGAGWARFARLASALDIEREQLAALDDLQAMHQLHIDALNAIPMATMPQEWARWAGGLGCIFHVAGDRRKAMHAFLLAVDAFPEQDTPRLARRLYRRLGAMLHESGDWADSLAAHTDALRFSDAIYLQTGATESATIELQEFKGIAILAAYAAARAGRPDTAAEMAERGRARMMVESVAGFDLPPEVQTEVLELNREIVRLESELRAAQAADPAIIAAQMIGTMADAIGGPSSVLGSRVTAEGAGTLDSSAARFDEISNAIGVVRVERRALLQTRAWSEEDIRRVAHAIQQPIVYLFDTMHGCMAVVVPVEGPIETLPLDGMNSDEASALVHDGYLQAAVYGDRPALQELLPHCLDRLREGIFAPLSEWLAARSYQRASLVPLGSLGLLPLEAASLSTDLTFTLAPSARLLRHAAAARRNRESGDDAFLIVGDPGSAEEAPLRFAVAEARRIARIMGDRGAAGVALIGAAATADAVRAGAERSSVVHLACHGRFRPSDPMQSVLMLAGDDHLLLQDLFDGRVDLSNTRLAVLSACQSASVEFERTPDEVVGFPAALLLAGIPSAVCTLWEVDDRATALLTQNFHERMAASVPAPEALRAAQRWLRDATAERLIPEVEKLKASLEPEDEDAYDAVSDLWRELIAADAGATPFSSPYYWAAFSYMGV